jgi:hypothetical protein
MFTTKIGLFRGMKRIMKGLLCMRQVPTSFATGSVASLRNVLTVRVREK